MLLETIVFGSISSFATRLAVYPLDTLKTRIQNTSPKQLPTILSVARQASLRSLYNGLPIALVLSVPGLAVYLATYEATKQRLLETNSMAPVLVHATAGTAAELLSGIFWTPMEVMKGQLQVDTKPGSGNIKSSMNLVGNIYRTEGLKGFFRGYFVTLGVFVPYTVIYFVTYEQFKEHLTSKKLVRPELSYFASSGIASIAASTVSNALDVIKTRIQVRKTEQSVFRVAMDMYRNEGGLWSFGRGLTMRIISVVPNALLSMTIFEMLKDRFSKKQ